MSLLTLSRPLQKNNHRSVRLLALLLAMLVAGFGVFYAVSPHKSLIRRRMMPGYWILALQGKTLYDPDLKILRRGNPDLPEVAITIDDGPRPENSIPMLDALKAANARATFYVVGKSAKAHPELIRRMIAEGHEVGSHTNEHLRLPTLTDAQARNTLKNAEFNVRRATGGYRMKTLRPPGGEIDARTAKIAKELGYTTVLWSATSGDYESQSPDYIVQEVMDGAENGAIIILHDAHQGTVQALPMLIRRLREAGFKLVTVSEMLERLPSS
ncbi:MAG: polysaccharide deacetylase family protein [Armatimonadetes bacterium]|nr:polysaccharide deacetylase family protein [Armatimonadota bacterium]